MSSGNYSQYGWKCPACGEIVTLSGADEAPHYCYKCPLCGKITGADEWKERLNAEWIPFMKAYRLYNPSKPQDTVAYVDSLDDVNESKYDLVLCDADSMHVEMLCD